MLPVGNDARKESSVTPTTVAAMREVSSRIRLSVTQPADLVFSVAVAASNDVTSETLEIDVDGTRLEPAELADAHGTRLHRVSAPTGILELAYDATVGTGTPLEPAPLDAVEYLRPSRYADSDRLANVAASHLGDLTGWELVQGARRWVLENVVYAPGSTDPVDGALETYLHREGVCRDSSHLIVAFLRARGVPARLVSAYAPGLVPMDFHAVVEALVGGAWHVVDGTGLASRPALVRIATGRDAADTAFLTVQSGRADLLSVSVSASARDGLPADDGVQPVRIS
jgi:transglutaminase-like putative cysteine protease